MHTYTHAHTHTQTGALMYVYMYIYKSEPHRHTNPQAFRRAGSPLCSGPSGELARRSVLGWLATLLAHGMVGEKRQRLAIVQKSPTVSLSNIQHILKDLSSVDDPEEKDIRIKDELNEHLAIDTPCGPLLQHVDLGTKTDTPYKWLVCNPFALLQYALPAASIVFYTDETATGNVQRYDKTRSLQCFYWTLKEFPSWMHKRKARKGQIMRSPPCTNTKDNA